MSPACCSWSVHVWRVCYRICFFPSWAMVYVGHLWHSR